MEDIGPEGLKKAKLGVGGQQLDLYDICDSWMARFYDSDLPIPGTIRKMPENHQNKSEML